MGRPEHLTITVTGPDGEIISTLRVVDNIKALIGPRNERTKSVDILEPRAEQSLRDHHPWETEIVLPKEIKGLTPEQAALTIVERLRAPIESVILHHQTGHSH